DDNTPANVTAEGHAVTPSLADFQTDRPFHLDALEGDWVPELILAQNDAGTRADPVIVVNTVTGGRLGIFYQTAGQDDDPRGEVISEWINNYVLTGGEIPNSPAWSPAPADGAIEVDTTALEWTAAYGAVSHDVYLSTDATIDDADLIGQSVLTIQVATLDPAVTYYWRVDEVDADGNVVEGDVWSLSTLALEAHFPSPVDGATNAVAVVLSWTPGKNAIMHNVHYGTDPAALLPVSMMQMGTTYDPGALDPDMTYYWRVDEFTPAGTVTGPVWSFSTIGAVTPSGIPDLIAQYEFEDGDVSLSALDTSGNNHHGPLLGDASIAGGVLSVDGDGDAVDAGSDPAFHPAGSFSISAYVNIHGWGGDWGNAIVGTRGESGIGWQLRRWGSSQNLTFTLRGTSGDDDPQGTIVPPLNEWIHVAAVYDVDAGTRAVYVNGALDVQIADGGAVAASDHNMFIGARASGGNTPEAFFNGDIDYVRIYSRALTIEEIRVTAGVEAQPWSPDPASGAAGLSSATVVLSWLPGEGAILQHVYLGTDAAAVAAADATDSTGIYRGPQPMTTYDPGALASAATYYWRVDQWSPDGIVAGPVWSFGTALLIPAGANLGAPTSDVPGFQIYAFMAQDTAGWSYNALNEILDTGLLNGLAADPASEGTRIDEFVNLRDTGNGAFSEGNGYPDAAFPGIDPDEVPAQDPAAGDDDNNYGAEIRGCVHLTAGMHQIGANSDDGTIVWIGGIEIGRTGEWKGASNVDLPTFEVEVDGYYNLKARWLEGGGGSSVELHEILADGTRLLLNDVANGGSAVFAPGPEVLKIDFSGTTGPVEAGFRAYVADHEQADTFTSQTFRAFGAVVTLTPSWAEGATRQAMQMIARGANAYTGAKVDLLGDWTGTDTRQPGNPMVLTISGLPAGTYEWTSYHHDNDDQSGIFDATVNDAAGSVTTTDVDISHSNSRNGDPDVVMDFANVTTFSTIMVSDGVNDISLSFSMTSGTESADPVHLKFFVMNGFELSLAP
ncbi:MAG: LamG domain-containing protein, partial [Phycisphaerae bacterium]|nr:LamG domain-containing protein [Phycisphaerae bacterium]